MAFHQELSWAAEGLGNQVPLSKGKEQHSALLALRAWQVAQHLIMLCSDPKKHPTTEVYVWGLPFSKTQIIKAGLAAPARPPRAVLSPIAQQTTPSRWCNWLQGSEGTTHWVGPCSTQEPARPQAFWYLLICVLSLSLYIYICIYIYI